MPAEQRVDFFRHNLGEQERERVLKALESPILTTGALVAEVEQELAAYLGVEHVVCLDSCTAALHLALVAHTIGAGDEVIVPAMTFVATANAVLMAGGQPVFADVDPATGCVTAETVARRITSRTRAIIPVHLYGLLCEMEALRELADAHGLALIEDSAHCLEARRGSVRPGSHGDCACFSFYATKNITCGEGGALATNDGRLAERVRRLSLHGMTTSAYDRYGKRYRHWDMPEWGWKYNLDNIRAALLLPQIARLDERWQRRLEIAERYESALSGVEGVEYQRVGEPNWSARHLFTIRVDSERRDQILAELGERGIGVTVNYRAVHLLEYFARRHRRGDFPAAELIGDGTISIPFYPQLTDAEIERVLTTVKQVVAVQQAIVAGD